MKMTLTSKPPGAKAPNLNVRHRRSLLLMQFTGTLKFWNDGRGFGFIEPTYSGQGILVVDPRQQPPPITAHSQFLALQLKPRMDGLDTPVYRRAPSHHAR